MGENLKRYWISPKLNPAAKLNHLNEKCKCFLKKMHFRVCQIKTQKTKLYFKKCQIVKCKTPGDYGENLFYNNVLKYK